MVFLHWSTHWALTMSCTEHLMISRIFKAYQTRSLKRRARLAREIWDGSREWVAMTCSEAFGRSWPSCSMVFWRLSVEHGPNPNARRSIVGNRFQSFNRTSHSSWRGMNHTRSKGREFASVWPVWMWCGTPVIVCLFWSYTVMILLLPSFSD